MIITRVRTCVDRINLALKLTGVRMVQEGTFERCNLSNGFTFAECLSYLIRSSRMADYSEVKKEVSEGVIDGRR